ncbi:MAG: HIT domain-containing protein [Actinomycetota bacterium]
MSDCLFCAIVRGDIPAAVVLRTDRILAFRDIDPKAPVHVLVIPVDHHPDVPAAALADPVLGAELLQAAAQVAVAEGVADSGYRLVANTGSDGGQTVHHAHLHVLGGRGLTWPPG